jgi:hypothetical protein
VPTVAVYVPAAKWRALEAEGIEPDEKIRQLALDGLDRHLAGSIEGSRMLSEREVSVGSAEADKRAPLGRPADSRSESDRFKGPDPKPGKVEKKGRR